MEENKQIKSEIALREEAVLEFWKENNIFEKSLEKESKNGEFVFYEGPPGANGAPMLHHFEARAFKDIIPRYKTMAGFHVDRRAGWDCHGLPVELQVEKELGLTSKKDIEVYGIAKFNAHCREAVLRYVSDWNKLTERMGYWVDNERAYYTMDNNFIESSWNVVAQASDRGNLYKDYKIISWCPRCGTGLSSHELGQPGAYVDVKDLSVTAKFKIIGFPDAYFIAWTTTPWTLPGNVALAVGPDIEYVEIKIKNEKSGIEEIYVLAKERLEIITSEYEIIATHKGSEMVGMKYEPIYSFYSDLVTGEEKDKLQNAYQIYSADFVTTDNGTGIVHIAPMYGVDDFELGTKNNLPKFHTVDDTGHFINGTDFLESRFAKDEEVAVDIIKDLAGRGLLFKKEKYDHSYPHCWRCKTALIYYARGSWYFAMSKLRNEMGDLNKEINWEPEHIKDGRFGEWLKNANDWAISRERYWGTPLPVWLSEDGDKIVVDSYEMLRKYTKKSGNKYFVMRHGGTVGNGSGIVSYKNQEKDELTEKGKEQVRASAGHYKDNDIDLIISSPFTRTKQTAEIVKEEIKLDAEIIYDERLCEINPGEYDGGNWKEYHEHIYGSGPNWYHQNIKGGESMAEVARRVGAVLEELEQKYKGKKILIVTHGGPAWLSFVCAGLYQPEDKKYQIENEHAFVGDFKKFQNAEIRPLDFVNIPHDENFEFDPHRPFIDEIVLEKDGKEFTRVKEVMDVWFDSGAMPYAQDHYPFENKEFVDEKNYPADFISEAIDQTRGWFYTLVAVSALIGRSAPFKNVICLGHLLDKNGVKMSKSKGNVINPWEQMEKFGADAVRLWMYMVTQPGDSKNYDEKTVKEIEGKIITLFNNVLSFYEIYRDKNLETNEIPNSKNILDIWIMTKLNEFINLTTTSLDNYKIFEPARALRDFMGDLSTWYLRRSRERLKDGDVDAKQTLYYVLKTTAKLMAPFAPFVAEEVWQKLKLDADVESVHLESWPEEIKIERGSVIEEMEKVREIVTLGLEARQKAGIKVRQPLAELKISGENLKDDFLEILKDELNVKEIIVDKNISGVELDVNITPELKQEGDYRELLRGVQDMRKASGLMASDMISLNIATNESGQQIINKFINDFKKTAGLTDVKFADNEGTEIKVDELVFKIEIVK